MALMQNQYSFLGGPNVMPQQQPGRLPGESMSDYIMRVQNGGQPTQQFTSDGPGVTGPGGETYSNMSDYILSTQGGQGSLDAGAGGLYGGGSGSYGGRDPNMIANDLFQNAQGWLNANPNIWGPYQGDMVAGLSPDQQAARQGFTNFLGGNPNQYAQNAYMTAQNAANYQPQNVQAGPVGAAQAAYAGDVGAPNLAASQAGYAGNVNAQNVQAQNFLGGDIGAYMNPYQSQVIDAALGDVERSRQIANQAGARSAGASTYGGDRNALIEAETNRGYADVAARTAAQLRSQGFDTASNLMTQDQNRALQAGSMNQGANLTAGLANQGMMQGLNQYNVGAQNQMAQYGAGLGLQAGLANQASQNQTSQYNTGAMNNMGQFNAATGLQAQGMNQQAGLAGAGMNLNAAGMMGGLGSDIWNQNMQGYQMQNAFGTQQQQTDQNMLNAQYGEWQNSQLGPMQGFNFLAGLNSGNQYQPTSPWSGLLGLGMTAASFIPGVGPIASGAAGAYNASQQFNQQPLFGQGNINPLYRQ